MMGGSGMPTPSEFWQGTIITDYIDPATGGNYTPMLVPTPESFASTSVPTGLADVQAAMGQQPADTPYLVEGYSQSAVITIDDELQLIQSGQTPPDATLLLLGSLNRPDGGLFERFPGLVIPGTGGFDFNGAEPTDALPTIDIANQYDFFADFPQYPTNLLADLNAVSASSTPTPLTATAHSPNRFRRSGLTRNRYRGRMPANTCWVQPKSFSRSTATPPSRIRERRRPRRQQRLRTLRRPTARLHHD
jgi:hypothetical protein